MLQVYARLKHTNGPTFYEEEEQTLNYITYVKEKS